VSIVRIGMSEDDKFGDGYDAIFGKKTAVQKPAAKKTAAKKPIAKKKPVAKKPVKKK
jgi:hypothetical protein